MFPWLRTLGGNGSTYSHHMKDARFYESPFTDVTPQGPDGIFSSAQVDELVATLDRVKAAAIAA